MLALELVISGTGMLLVTVLAFCALLRDIIKDYKLVNWFHFICFFFKHVCVYTGLHNKLPDVIYITEVRSVNEHSCFLASARDDITQFQFFLPIFSPLPARTSRYLYQFEVFTLSEN